MEFLGSEEVHKGKIYALLLFILLYAFAFFALIGATGSQRSLATFYIMLTGIVGFAPIVVDIALTRKEFPLDTVIHEGEDGFRSFKMTVIISLVISAAYGFFVYSSGRALIQAPEFSVFSSRAGNAIASGAFGALETLPFFTFLFPTSYAFLSERLGKAALIAAAAISIAAFTIFHFWAYQYNTLAFQSIAVFAAINIALLYIFRSSVPLLFLHFTNNILVTIFLVNHFGLFLGGV